MVKILVKKSAPKGVLVKQVQPQLMQMPKEGKTFGQFYDVFRNKNKTPGVGVKQKLAGLLGMMGKVGAGLATAQQTASAMQGGNLSAPLSAGYAYESLDPTGRKISEAANPNPQPTSRAKITNVPLPGQNTTPPAPAVPPAPTLPTPPPAPTLPPAPAPVATNMPQLGGGHPQFTGVPPNMPPLPPPPSAYGISVPQPQSMTTQPVPQPQQTMSVAQANNALKTNEEMAAQSQGVQPQFMENQATPVQTPVQPDFFINNIDPTTGQPKIASFVTALTEKLGADIVYKMTPHEIGTFAAYTLLKLR